MACLYNVALALCLAVLIISTLAEDGYLVTQNPSPTRGLGRVAGQCSYAGSGAEQATCNNVCFNVVRTSYSFFVQPGGYCYCMA